MEYDSGQDKYLISDNNFDFLQHLHDDLKIIFPHYASNKNVKYY